MTETVKSPLGFPLPTAARRSLVRRVLGKPLGAAAVLWLGLVILASVLAPVLAPHLPNAIDLNAVLDGPSASHILGTDGAGRDVLTRLMYGGQLTLLAAALATGVALLAGVPAGLLAGFYGKWFDWLGSWGANILLSLPPIIVLLAVRAAVGPSVWVLMAVLGVIISPTFFRLTRTAVQAVRKEAYVDAARVSGMSDARIISRHILYVVRAPIIIQAALVAGIAINVQSGLEFLGLGDVNVPSWGAMLNDGFRNIYLQPLNILWPALAISVTVAALGLLGNALRDSLEDRKQDTRAQAPAPDGATKAPGLVGATPEPESGAILTVDRLGIAYPTGSGRLTTVVNGISLSVRPGEVVGIVGESGSGKSQTAFGILGLLPGEAVVTGGNISIEGEPVVRDGIRNETAIRRLRGRAISYVPQEPMSNLDPNYTIGYQLIQPMVEVLGISRKEAKTRAVALLRRVKITDPERTMGAYPHEISGGMAQRVLIAGAVSCGPRLIVADEPTTALDVTVQAEVLDLLRELRQSTGTAMLMVTHNFGVVADICDQVVVMQNGEVVETGAVRDVLREPRHAYTRSLLSYTLEDKEPFTMLTVQAGGAA